MSSTTEGDTARLDFADVDAVLAALEAQDYLADRGLATSVFLALKLQRALLLEGEAGVGKTEIARVLATLAGTELIRLQCYEGIDIHQAAYEWNVARQMIEIRLAEAAKADIPLRSESLYRRELLIERPLLQALSVTPPPVLLIDELDRADEPFEAFLLELLADYQLSIPEFGTISASTAPIVILTSNRTREIHDALKRRCLYAWVDWPDAARELAIVRRKVPGVNARLAEQVVAFVQAMRQRDLFKQAGIAETLDWVNALVALNAMHLDPESVNDTLGVLLKHQDDIARMQQGGTESILDALRAQQLIE